MFTGITRGTFEVTQVERAPNLLTYTVALGEQGEGLELGASVSIDGVCQTVASIAEGDITFEAIKETLDLTTLGEIEVGSLVSVERSARVGDEIGGHDVAGHVNGTGEVVSVHHDGHVWDLRIGIPKPWMRFVLTKGFIAVDGSSLTVSDVDPEGAFSVHLIPETLRLTNLGSKKVGDRVNIELDPRTVAIVETVERVMAQRESG